MSSITTSHGFTHSTVASSTVTPVEDGSTSPLFNCMLAGGFGGAVGDSVMHSLDTVKTRQQGAPYQIKYRSMLSSYKTILVEEGVARGLYSGYCAAMLGSFPSAALFFGTYETVKRVLIGEYGVNETFTHLTAGFLGDLASSIVYVPSEVLKTRLQLQGRYNNPHFDSGYNYKNLRDAIKTIVKEEGAGTLFYGYKATLVRDLPFSALQFAFYEKFREAAFHYKGLNLKNDFDANLELVTGAAAGGLAGIITTPLDVLKTRIQTQNSITSLQPSSGAAQLSGSIGQSLRLVFKTEGVFGLFSGVGPRFVWTSIQSSIMLLLYQIALKQLDQYGDERLA